jgi:hypothetical protein
LERFHIENAIKDLWDLKPSSLSSTKERHFDDVFDEEHKMDTYSDALACLREGSWHGYKNRKDLACQKQLPKIEDPRSVVCAWVVWCSVLSGES